MLRKKKKLSVTDILQNIPEKHRLENYIFQNKDLIKWQDSVITSGFVSGFVDAEGSFVVGLQARVDRWPTVHPQLLFSLGALEGYEKVLQEINHKFFKGLGKIRFQKKSMVVLEFQGSTVIAKVVVPFFLQNSLLSSKYYDFEKFVQVHYLINDKRHKSIEGMRQIIQLAYSMNSGKGGRDNLRIYSQQQLLNYLDVAQTRDIYKQIRNKIPLLRKQMLISRLDLRKQRECTD
eukprot:TRINITY_DN4452_c0_g1_i7.p1 TRINITY_DN4452_c0_g1~~TRINITY_DN4452_c0_g1_i7.p1  ORF type:complete len:233 (-),score=10.85 TRINITY_DN4452_c0_g1_i7:279-977(-)